MTTYHKVTCIYGLNEWITSYKPNKGQSPGDSYCNDICKNTSKSTIIFNNKKTLLRGFHVNDSEYDQRTSQNIL